MTISIIIPSYNGEKTLGELLATLHSQSVPLDEIIVVDSSSVDGTSSLCRRHGVKLVVIPQHEFDHGGTRTRMAMKATGDILVFFTQDAIPATSTVIEKLIAPILRDQEIATTYGRQLPNENATFAAAFLRKFNYPRNSVTRRYEDRYVLGIRTIFTSNTCAAYRKSALADVGYFKNGLIFGEDTCTAGRLLQKGHKIAYVAEATVFHSHNYHLLEEFRRSFDIGVLHSTERTLFDDFGRAENHGAAYVRSGFAELWREKRIVEIIDFAVRAVMKLSGYKIGKAYRAIPRNIVPLLSLHRSWWGKVSNNP